MEGKRKHFLLFLVLAAAVIFNMAVFAETVETRKITANKYAAAYSVPIKKGTWKASADQKWITFKKASKGKKLKITVSQNTGTARTGTLTIRSKKNADTVIRIVFRQAASDSVLDGFMYDWFSAGKELKKKDVTKKFLKKVVYYSKKLGVTPDDLMTVMAFESGLNHKAVNPWSGATGLIQFMNFTASSLGTTQAKLKKMSAVKQMKYVYKYLNSVSLTRGKLKNLGDLYMAILWPAGVGHKDSYVLWKSGSVQYPANSGLDVNKDGKITRKECLKRVTDTRKAYVGA